MMDNFIAEFEQALLTLDRLAARRIADEAGQRLAPLEFIKTVVIPVMERIGEGWSEGAVALSQVYMGGRICEEIVDAMLPPGAAERIDQPKMAIAVFEDHHLLGKRIVHSTLRANGFELYDYGCVDLEKLVQRVEEDGIQILMLSTLMLSSALRIKEIRARLSADVKIVVGGAPFRFDDQLWREVGADAVGQTASDAVAIVNQLIGERS